MNDKNIQRVYQTAVADVYPHYVKKALKKGGTEQDVLTIMSWLTGYTDGQIQDTLKNKVSFETFISSAPLLNPARAQITGVICGVRVEEMPSSTMKEIRYLDKMVDELAKGKPMEKILR